MSDFVEFGIDLGTTNSCVAQWQNGSTKVFQNTDNMNVTPSAVHILKSGRIIVGRRAYSALQTDPQNVEVEFKRWMGQSNRKSFPSIQKEFSAEDLSAEVLKSLRDDVKRQTGKEFETAVITVPAAFGALQCEATARAAEKAGLIESPLLQEPIAAAIGYGVKVENKDQKWMVFDFGGGTLDIAIISTKEGRLNVLEHRGDNLLGGKDIDRKLLDEIIVPALQQNYKLSITSSGTLRTGLYARLKAKTEEAKIDLSSRNEVMLALYDVGDDDEGNRIEIELPLSRSQLESFAEPVFDQACTLAAEAIANARLDKSDIHKILLVGGPTQTPLLRQMLDNRFRVPLDFSMDPMTVVGQGAAVYASTLKRNIKKERVTDSDAVSVKLAYESVSARNPTVVQGRVQEGLEGAEIRIDAEGGFWTSGWIRPDAKGVFQLDVSLKEGDVTNFWVYVRDQQGGLLSVDTPEFKIRHGLVPSSPPLPHTISVEVHTANNKAILDPIFKKGTSLPATVNRKYQTEHSLVPNNPNTDIAIKLWEGEYFSEPEANEWVGNVLLSNESVPRTIPEGAEVQISFEVDVSRRVKVNAFIPILNKNFPGEVYAPLKAEQDFVSLAKQSDKEAEQLARRLDELETAHTPGRDAAADREIAELKDAVEELSENSRKLQKEDNVDPDAARRTVEHSRRTRGRISKLEDKAAPHAGVKLEEIEAQTALAEEVVEQFGTTLEKQQLKMLKKELERAFSKTDQKAVRRMVDEIEGLRWRVLGKQDWFWRELFLGLAGSEAKFSDPQRASKLIATGHRAVTSGNADEIREVVRELWKLQSQTAVDAMTDRALRSGLKKS